MKIKGTLRWVPAVIWSMIIFWQSSLSRVPGVETGEAIVGSSFSILMHIAEYGVLTFFIAIALRLASRGFGAWIGSFFLIGTLGVLDEVHQAFVPGRVPAFSDVVWDMMGAGLFLMTWRIWRVLGSRLG